MDETENPITVYRLNGQGGGERVSIDSLQTPLDVGFFWVHLNRQSPEAQRWLRENSNLDAVVQDVLSAEETRPRCSDHGNGVILNLRGVNLNPGADPEDMVSIRAWIEPTKIITTRLRRLMAARDIMESIDHGKGPRNAGEFVAMLSARLVTRMEPVITDLDDQVDELEDEILTGESHELRARLGMLRRMAIAFRRYLAPQRDALSHLYQADADWLDTRNRARLRETADRVTRYIEDLDSARDRAAVIHDELANRLSEQMNKTMYVLSIVAAVFLPLGLLTGLLGINVGGIPGAETPWAFAAVCVLLLAIGALEIWIFRKLKWI